MKNSLTNRVLFVILLMLLVLSETAYAQKENVETGYSAGIVAQEAIIDDRLRIVLNTDTALPLQPTYKIDINQLSFSSEQEAGETFSFLEDNLLQFDIDYERREVVMTLQLEYAPQGWKHEEWNNYLAQKSEYYQSLHN